MSDHRQHADQDSFIRRVTPNRNTPPPQESQRALYSDFAQQNQYQDTATEHQQFKSRLGSSSAFQSYNHNIPPNYVNGSTPVKSSWRGLESEPSRPTFSPGPMLPMESMQRNNNSGQYNVDIKLSRQGDNGSFSHIEGRRGGQSAVGYTPGPRKSGGSTSDSPQYGAFTFASPLAGASEEFARNIASSQSTFTSEIAGVGDTNRAQESSPDNLLRSVGDFIRVGMGDGDTWGQMAGNTYPAPPSFSVEPQPNQGDIFGSNRSSMGMNNPGDPGPIDLTRSATADSQESQNFLGSFDPHNSSIGGSILNHNSVDSMNYGLTGGIFGSSPRASVQDSSSSEIRFPSADYTPAGQATSNYFGNDLLESLGGGSSNESIIDYRNDGSRGMGSQGSSQFGGLSLNRESWDMHQQQHQRQQEQYQNMLSSSSSSLNVGQSDVPLYWTNDGSAPSFKAPPRSLSPTSFQQDKGEVRYERRSVQNFPRSSHTSDTYSYGGGSRSQQSSYDSTDMKNYQQQQSQQRLNTSGSNFSKESGSMQKPKWAGSEPTNIRDVRKSGSLDGHSDGRDPQRRNNRQIGGERSSRDSSITSASNRSSGNRSHVSESRDVREQWKTFHANLKLEEKKSLDAAREYAERALQWVYEELKWKVYAELAEIAKRCDQFEKARELYSTVCDLQPSSDKTWLEWSKLEEECGEIGRSLKVLKKGMEKCTNFNDQLLTRAVKQQERLNNVEEARKMLSVLKHESIEKGWKPMLEGALMEGRDGKIKAAREFLKYLISHVPWYGPIYYEAFRLEEKCQNYDSAYLIVRQGLKELPRYGPLWFGLMRLSEKDDITEESSNWACGVRPQLRRIRAEKKKGAQSISRELVWRLHLEAGQAEERAADIAAEGRNRRKNISLEAARNRLYSAVRYNYAQSLVACPSNLRWKVWLAGARLELAAGQLAVTRRLLRKAYEETPDKSRAFVYLECSRVEEYIGNIHGARRILEIARRDVKQEWKVFLESVLLEARDGNMLLAIEVAKKSLKLHTGTGRLWALLIQLCHRQECLPHCQSYTGIDTDLILSGYDHDLIDESADVFNNLQGVVPLKTEVLRKALDEVPKSGEVWCEGARVYMNPLLLESFDLIEAQRELNFAIQFTPQYGDTFIEYLRLEILMQVILSKVMEKLGLSLFKFVDTFLKEETSSDVVSVAEQKKRGEDGKIAQEVSREERIKNIIAIENMEPLITFDKKEFKDVIVEKLFRRCLNADPNYGTLWFACRLRPYDTPGSILKEAIEMLVHEMLNVHDIYVRAISRYVRRCIQFVIRHYRQNDGIEDAKLPIRLCIDEREAMELEEDFQQSENYFGSYYRSQAALKIPIVHISTGVFTSSDFVSGLVDLNRTLFKKGLEGEERRKVLFGSDHYSIA